VSGREHIEALQPPLVIAANHSSHTDVIVIREAVPASWRPSLVAAAAADYFFEGGARMLMASLAFNTLPLERYESPRRSLRTAVNVLRSGTALIIFPEGGRLVGRPGLRPFQGGVAFLARHAGVPVVPACIWGTQDLMPKGRNLPRRADVRIEFGPPLHLAEGERLQDFTGRVRQAVIDAAARLKAWPLVYGTAEED
jgi:1-acyl-sn-glycerol-3-phosphate acyltransferase